VETGNHKKSNKKNLFKFFFHHIILPNPDIRKTIKKAGGKSAKDKNYNNKKITQST
jgi:hypothetical protein